jgi:hypothetical protein
MAKKIVGPLVVLICVVWIAFVVKEVLQKKKESDFLCYFGPQDSLVLVIHHKEEFVWEDLGFNTLGSNKDLFYEITRNLDNDYSVFISKERPLLVIEINQKWTKSSLKHLFEKGYRKFNSTGLKSFEYGPYIGRYEGKQLMIYPKDYKIELISNSPFKVDKQASYSIVKFDKKETHIEDVYLKDDCKVVYESQKCKNIKSNLVDDRSLFAENLPSNFSSYTFYEKNYLRELDPVFKKGLFQNWIESGMVELIIDDQKVLIFDVLEGQSPIQNLNNALNKEEENITTGFYVGVPIKSGPEDYATLGFFIAEANGYAYISLNKEAIDKVLTEIKMNHTLSSDKKQFSSLINYLPLYVSERTINKDKQESISQIGDKKIKTNVYFFNNKSAINESETNQYFSMNPGSRITAFCALAGRGNSIVFSENQELHGYKNGTKVWSRKTNSPLISEPIILSFSQNERESIALRFNDKVEVIDKLGRVTQSIPGTFVANPIRYLLNDKFQILCASKLALQAFNEQGNITFNQSVMQDVQDVSVYYDGKKPICTILSDGQVQLIDLGSKKLIRRTNLPENTSEKKIVENGACVFIENQTYMILDNKGIKTKLNLDKSWTLKSNYIFQNIPYLLFTKQNQCVLIKNDGVKIWTKTLPIRELTSINIAKINEVVIFTIFDNIENNVYLYNMNGVQLDQVLRHADGPAQTTSFGTLGQSITTLLGNVLIQYTKY